KEGEPYYLGMFLLGGYQDIMGDMHNLFGRVNEVHVFCDDEDPEDFYLEEVIPGDRVKDVLSRVQYAPSELLKTVKTAIDQQVRKGAVKPKEGVSLTDFYEETINGYTYLHSSGVPSQSGAAGSNSSDSSPEALGMNAAAINQDTPSPPAKSKI